MGVLHVILGLLLGTWIWVVKSKLSARTGAPLMSEFLGQAIKYILVIITVKLALEATDLETLATGILTATSASAVILGFAFKNSRDKTIWQGN